MSTLLVLAGTAIGAVALFLASTVVFDVVHFGLHRAMASRHAALRAVGGLHAWHHRFADRDLEIHVEHLSQNLRWHAIPEYLTQTGFSLLLLLVLPATMVLGALSLQALVFALILRARGMDINHRPIASLRAYRPSYFCLPAYHALHHAWPDAHFSSWIKTLDHGLRTGAQLAGRRVAFGTRTVGGPLGAALRRELATANAAAMGTLKAPNDAFGEHRLREALRSLDILVVDADADGVSWIERFIDAAAGRKLPPEVWAIAAGGPGLPASRPATLRFWKDARVVYRHLARSDESLREGPAAEGAARRALRGIARGFHLVPAGGLGCGLAAWRARWGRAAIAGARN